MSVTRSQMTHSVFLVLLDGDLVETPEHLGVSYLTAVLRSAGYRCEIIEAPSDADHSAVQKIRDLQPAMVGISLTTVNVPRARALGRLLREELGDSVHLCAGGPIATFMGHRLIASDDWSFLDSIVRGEAESVIIPFCERVLAGDSVAGLPGVLTRDNPLAINATPQAVDDLDGLPWPARDQLIRHSGRFPYVRISTSRGCTSKCTFCNAPHAGNNLARRKLWRARSPEDVIDELQYLHSHHGVDTFDFVDSTFEDPRGPIGKRRVRDFAELILNRKLPIYYNICSQAMNWRDEDSELLQLLYESGLEKVLIGIESGSDRMLRLYKKRSTTADNRRAIRLFRQHGVYVAYGFIMFHPLAEWGDIVDNARFLLETYGHNLRRFTTRLEVYPGAEVLPQLISDGLLNPAYHDTLEPYAYRYLNPAIGRFAESLNALFGQPYLRHSRIDREPAVFRFETFDVRLHTFLARLKRHCDEAADAELIEEHEWLIDQEKAKLTEFNENLFFDALSSVQAGREPQLDSTTVENRYDSAIRTMQAIQLRLGMRLRRSRPAQLLSRGA